MQGYEMVTERKTMSNQSRKERIAPSVYVYVGMDRIGKVVEKRGSRRGR